MPFFCSCVFFVFGVQLLSSKKLVLPSLLLTCVVYGVGLSFIGGRCSHRSGSRFSLGVWCGGGLEVSLTTISGGEAREDGRDMGRQLSVYPLHYVFTPLCFFFGCNFFTYSSCGYVDMGFCVFLRGVIYIFFLFSSFYERVMCLSVWNVCEGAGRRGSGWFIMFFCFTYCLLLLCLRKRGMWY